VTLPWVADFDPNTTSPVERRWQPRISDHRGQPREVHLMSTTAADVLVDCLVACNVQIVFGLPGDGINGIMESLRQRQREIRFIQVRHEESAAFMACSYAKLTGKLGVCLATSGPGGIHLLNGLYDAKLDGAPVLAITGLQFHDLVHTHTQQDVELDQLFADVCVYNARIMGPAHVENVTELACRTALARCGVAHVTMPVDMQSMPLKSDPRSARNVTHHVSMVAANGLPVPRRGQAAAGGRHSQRWKEGLYLSRPWRALRQG
jgi:pyruvate dehydrogenase (quinone)/pyruvate oxidase